MAGARTTGPEPAKDYVSDGKAIGGGGVAHQRRTQYNCRLFDGPPERREDAGS